MGKSTTAVKPHASQFLPGRHSLNTLTKGDPMQRSQNAYSKATPDSLTGQGVSGMNLGGEPPAPRSMQIAGAGMMPGSDT